MMTTKPAMALPEHILKRIRQWNDLDENDTSMDEAFNKMSPLEALRVVIGWELGYDAWADRFFDWAKACGFDVDPDQTVVRQSLKKSA